MIDLVSVLSLGRTVIEPPKESGPGLRFPFHVSVVHNGCLPLLRIPGPHHGPPAIGPSDGAQHCTIPLSVTIDWCNLETTMLLSKSHDMKPRLDRIFSQPTEAVAFPKRL